MKHIKAYEAFDASESIWPTRQKGFASKMTGSRKNELGIYKIDQHALDELKYYSVIFRDYPGRRLGTTVVGEDDAQYIDSCLDAQNIEARVYLGPRFHYGREALSIAVVYRTEEDKKKGDDIIKKCGISYV